MYVGDKDAASFRLWHLVVASLSIQNLSTAKTSAQLTRPELRTAKTSAQLTRPELRTSRKV